jgi:hypothetical protein
MDGKETLLTPYQDAKGEEVENVAYCVIPTLTPNVLVRVVVAEEPPDEVIFVKIELVTVPEVATPDQVPALQEAVTVSEEIVLVLIEAPSIFDTGVIVAPTETGFEAPLG